MKISPFDIVRLKNSEHYMFIEEIITSVEKFNARKLGIQTQYDELVRVFEMEKKAFKPIEKSSFTAEIQTADKTRDKIFRGMVYAVKSALNSMDEDKQKSAKQIKILLDSYGNVAPKVLVQESAEIINLLEELNGKYYPYVTIIGITGFVEDLKTANNKFIQLYRERVEESTEKTSAPLTDIRPTIDAAYKAIAELVNAQVIVSGEENYRDFINYVNRIIKKYAVLISARKKKN